MTRSVSLRLGEGGYTIRVGSDALSEISGDLLSDHIRLIVTDETVGKLHLPTLTDALGRQRARGHRIEPPEVVVLPPGEASKSLARAGELYDRLAELRVERSDIIAAFGGGVVGDLTGFVAATWLRGIRFIQIPTTLEAAIDASVGGKTGINHPAGKNLIGAFHQPAGVFIDPAFLKTLPERDFRAGLAESIKHAATRDEAFFEWHERQVGQASVRAPNSAPAEERARRPAPLSELMNDADAIEELIERNCRIKAAVVEADEREAGLRAVLNYGHTIGHAIEHLLRYELRHGECVALGMRVENEIAIRRGMMFPVDAERIANLLDAAGLPLELPERVEPESIAERCRLDKKVRGGAVRMAVPSRIGSWQALESVTGAEIASALTTIQPPM